MMRRAHLAAIAAAVTLLILGASAGCSDDGGAPASDSAKAVDQGAIDQSTAADGPVADRPAVDSGQRDQAPMEDHEQAPDLKPPDLGQQPDVGAGQCATHCDCTQGLLCSNGKCISGFVPTYCCTKPGCPAKQLCYNPDGSKGNCP